MDKLLIIDDSVEFCRLMGVLLQQEGYEVVSANDGSTGLDKAEAEQPDLIILDSRMPGMSGREVFAELRNRESTRFTPVIMLTAYADDPEGDKLIALRLGLDDFLTKPISPSTLYSTINKLISNRRNHPPTQSTYLGEV
jgi:two-component system, OmpR family, alkaline phosphatase synthesis response regulator PhoP